MLMGVVGGSGGSDGGSGGWRWMLVGVGCGEWQVVVGLGKCCY